MKQFHVRMGGDPFEVEVDIPVNIGKHYEVVKIIGSGSFSVVVLVYHRPTNMHLACKISSRKLLMAANTFERFEQEVRLLEVMRHPNLVRLVDIIFDDELIYVIMEYCSKGELFYYIAQNGRLDPLLCHRIFRQLVSAMIYLHARDIAHRDLKPENILLDDDLNPKITDFGLCHVASPNQLLSTPCGSPFYAPPEIISNEEYDGKKSDVWSLGVVLFTMAVGALPWKDTNQIYLFEEIKNADYRIPTFVDQKLRDLIQQMMNPIPAERPTMEQVAEHPWVVAELDEMPELDSGRRQQGTARSQMSFDQRAMATAPLQGVDGPLKLHRRQLIIRPNVTSAQAFKINSTQNQPLQNLIRRIPSSGRHRV